MSDTIHHLKITGESHHPTVTLDGRPLIATALTLHLDANDPIPRATIEVPVSVDIDTGVIASITGGIFHQAKP